MTDTENTSVLALIEEKSAIQAYTDGTIDEILEKIAVTARAQETDVTTHNGRENIRSLAHKVARSKTALDGFGKNLVADWKSKAAKIDEERRKARGFLDNLKDEVRAPLTEYEDREKQRVAIHQEKLAELEVLAGAEDNSAALEEAIKAVETIKIDASWEEFEARASETKGLILEALNSRLGRERKHEHEAAELERLRREAAERVRQDHEEKIAREAAEKATQAAKMEAERKELQRQEEATCAKIQAEKLEHDKQEAEERAARAEAEAIQAAERAQQEAEERIAEAKRIEAAERAARERDRDHKAKINVAAAQAIIACSDVTLEQAKRIVAAIARSKVPAVTINY